MNPCEESHKNSPQDPALSKDIYTPVSKDGAKPGLFISKPKEYALIGEESESCAGDRYSNQNKLLSVTENETNVHCIGKCQIARAVSAARKEVEVNLESVP